MTAKTILKYVRLYDICWFVLIIYGLLYLTASSWQDLVIQQTNMLTGQKMPGDIPMSALTIALDIILATIMTVWVTHPRLRFTDRLYKEVAEGPGDRAAILTHQRQDQSEGTGEASEASAAGHLGPTFDLQTELYIVLYRLYRKALNWKAVHLPPAHQAPKVGNK